MGLLLVVIFFLLVFIGVTLERVLATLKRHTGELPQYDAVDAAVWAAEDKARTRH